MLTNTHTPTLVLTLIIAATAIGVMTAVEPRDVQIDIAAIETPKPDIPEVSTQNVNRVWWNLLGKVVDRLNDGPGGLHETVPKP